MVRKFVLWFKTLLYRPLILEKPPESLKNKALTSRHRRNKSIRESIPSSVTHQVVLGRPRVCTLFGSNAVTMSLRPPESVKGMLTLDRGKFLTTVSVPCLPVPAEAISGILSVVKKYFIKLPKLSSICDLQQDDPDKETHRLLLFDPDKLQTIDDFSDKEKTLLIEAGVNLERLRKYDLQLKYENWTGPDLLQAIIPDGVANVTGFTIVGHIAHFNLKPEALPWKNIIGQVTLDKNPLLKTVVNKTSEIDNTFRTFQMEVLAGEDNMVTTVKENGVSFQFDFSKVYWNSRLGTEHQRVANLVSEGDIVYDVFAGVGPFAIPMSKRKATVFANDLNPFSYESLQANVKLNKVDSITCSNLDGRDFIRTVLKPDLLKRLTNCAETRTKCNCVVVMNLPALAIEFLDAFVGLYTDVDVQQLQDDSIVRASLPKVHCYCFQTTDDMDETQIAQAVKERVLAVLGPSVEADLSIRFVRNVAPSKDMMCARFSLTWKLLCDTRTDTGEPAAKQRRVCDELER